MTKDLLKHRLQERSPKATFRILKSWQPGWEAGRFPRECRHGRALAAAQILGLIWNKGNEESGLTNAGVESQKRRGERPGQINV